MSSNTKTIIINQITNFIDELINTYPQNNELKLFKEKYIMIKSVNSKLVLEYFIKYIYPHKENIRNENEQFFIEGGGQEEIQDKNGLKFRDNMKNLWNENMKEENKKVIWKYFKTFILLIDKYILENA
jgi:hypothetical protein